MGSQSFLREFELSELLGKAFEFIASKQLSDGCITDTHENLILGIWDSVHALRAYALWRDQLPGQHKTTLEKLRMFLHASETPEGLISWGDKEPGEYSGETSSEYITALIHLGEKAAALAKAHTLRAAQTPSGPWRETHKHIPEVFQTMPSVTGFVLRVMWLLELEPPYPEKALSFLMSSQNEEGHWGYNWYYNAVPYYVTMPVTAALARFNCYRALAKTRTYVLSRQRENGSWFFDMADIAGQYEKQLSDCIHTAYALETLANCGLMPDDPPVQKGLSWLLKRQRADGSWHGGSFPYPPSEQYNNFRTTQDVYGTATVLVALRRFVDLR